MKKIIFFDADGTLWYPTKTKYTERPWWIYEDPKISKRDYLKHTSLMPNTKRTLVKLKNLGILLVIVSQLPYSKNRALRIMKTKLKYFGIYDYFDDIVPSYRIRGRIHTNSKDKSILLCLKRYKASKSSAMLVGDSYNNDYLVAKRCGIDSLLINSFAHTKNDARYNRVSRKISDIGGIFKFLK